MVLPKPKRKELIIQFHNFLGHPGIEKTTKIMKDEYYWPNMENDISRVIGECKECSNNKNKNGRIRAPLQSIIGEKPFQIIGIDITGPFKSTKYGYKYILGIIDYFSKYISLIPLKNIEAENIAKLLWSQWISKFGPPEQIHSDCGSNFQSRFFAEYCRVLGIKKTFTSPYYPQSDGLVERLFGTSKSMIAAVLEERRSQDWSEILPVIEFGLRTTIQKSTNYSPYEIVFGSRAKLPISTIRARIGHIEDYDDYVQRLQQNLSDVHDKVRKNMDKQREKVTGRYNRNRLHKELKLGDKVLVKNEDKRGFEKKYIGPFVIEEIIDNWTYVLYSDQIKKRIRRNYNQIKVVNDKGTSDRTNSAATSIWSRRPPTEVKTTRRYSLRTTRNQMSRYRSIVNEGM